MRKPGGHVRPHGGVTFEYADPPGAGEAPARFGVAAHYAAVSRHLGIDPDTGEGPWPPGLLSHAAGTADDGTFIVSEMWSSREDQVAWEQKLGPALAAGGMTVVPRVRWVPLIACHRT